MSKCILIDGVILTPETANVIFSSYQSRVNNKKARRAMLSLACQAEEPELIFDERLLSP